MASFIIPTPQTIARLQPFITLYNAGGAVRKTLNDVYSTDSTTTLGTPIGTVRSFDLKIRREAGVWRHLDYRNAGAPVEAYPQLPSYELSLEKVVLYANPMATNGTLQADSIMNMFGFGGYNNGFDVLAQNKPLNMSVVMQSPHNADGSVVDGYPDAVSLTVMGMWFTGFPLKFDLGSNDMLIIQSVDAVAAGVFTV